MKDLSSYFRARLVEAWDEHSVGSAAVDDDLYVQWSAQSAGLQIECVSDRHLPDDRKLSFEQRRRLQKAGWEPPVGDDLPNHWQRFTDRQQLPQAVEALVDAVDILRLSLPSSDSAPQLTVERLAPAARPTQRAAGERRTTVIVPVYKSGTELVTWAARALLDRTSAHVTVVDLLGVDEDDLPPGLRVHGLGGPGLHPSEEVVVARPKEPLTSDLATWLRISADLLAVLDSARTQDRDVVVLAPWLLERDPWLYAGVVREVADELVLCVDSDGQGYAQEVALPVVQAPGCPAPIVLMGEHAADLDRLISRARAALPVGSEKDEDTLRAFEILLEPSSSDTECASDHVAELVVTALNASLWSRFRLLMFRQLPEPELGEEALLLLADLTALVGATHPGPLREDALRLLGGMVIRIGYWVDRASEDVKALLAVAAELRQLDADVANHAERLESFSCQPADDRPPEQRESGGQHADSHVDRLETQMHYIEAGTTCGSKTEFAQVLEEWLAHEDREATVGPPSSYAGKPLVWTDLDGRRFHLNGDSQDKGVREYLDLVQEYGAEIPWHVIANTHGKVNRVAFGEPPQAMRYFYLYAKDEASAPYTI